jgi:hypothetical protein
MTDYSQIIYSDQIFMMPETDDQAFCLMLTGAVDAEDYHRLIVKQILKRIREKQDLNFLMYYKNFAGWTQDAARISLHFFTSPAAMFNHHALINPSEVEFTRALLRANILGYEVRRYPEEEFEEALAWVRGGGPPDPHVAELQRQLLEEIEDSD